jgi:hypothetical protein
MSRVWLQRRAAALLHPMLHRRKNGLHIHRYHVALWLDHGVK